MERSRKLIVLGAATAVVVAALGAAWVAGLFDRSAAPEGAIAQDSVTIAVGDRGPLEQLASPAVIGLGLVVIALAVGVAWLARRRRNQASFPPAERGRHG